MDTETLSLNERALIIAQTPTRGTGQRTSPLPSLVELCTEAGISTYTATSAARVLQHGTPMMQRAVRENLLPISVGRRLITLPDEEQDSIALRVLNGGHWKNVVPGKRINRLRTAKPTEAKPKVRREVVAAVRDSLTGLQHLLARADGLDPEITPAEAAVWLRDLGQGRKSLVRLTEMLKERSS